MRPRFADPSCSSVETPSSSSAEVTTVDLSSSRSGCTYLLMEPIGGGGTGRVWRAIDRDSGDQVAIKLLHRELMSEPKAVTRFMQERSILLMLQHPHIVRVRDLLTIGESLGLVMDLVGGGSLREHLRRHGTLTPAVAATIVGQVARALTEAHRLGIVHRDLKPDNILIDPAFTDPADADRPDGRETELAGTNAAGTNATGTNAGEADAAGTDPGEANAAGTHPGEADSPCAAAVTGVAAAKRAGPAEAVQPHVRLTDFGIARLLDSPGLTTPQALVGTPNYLAPEVISGAPPSPAVDVYAAGALLYELLLGRPPYAGGPAVAVLRRHLECAPVRHHGVPDALWDVIVACLAKEPADRPSADELVATMSGLVSTVAGVPAAPRAPAVPPQRTGDRVDCATGSTGSAAATGDRPTPGRRGAHARPVRWRPLRGRGPLLGLVAGLATIALLAAWGTATGTLPDWMTAARPEAAPGELRVAPNPDRARPATPPPASPAASPTAPVGGAAERPRPEALQRRPTAPKARVSAKVYGALRCADKYVWDIGHPAVALPCHATGPKIRLVGRLQAIPGVQADVTLSLQDVATGRTVAGPYTCPGLLFTGFSGERTCGPFHASPRRGRQYAVVQSWAYTGQRELPPGTARSTPFRW